MHHLIQSCIMKDSPTVVLSLTQETMARNCGIFSSCKLSLVSALLLSKSISWSNTFVFTTVGWSESFGWIYKNEKYLEIFVKVSVGTIFIHKLQFSTIWKLPMIVMLELLPVQETLFGKALTFQTALWLRTVPQPEEKLSNDLFRIWYA